MSVHLSHCACAYKPLYVCVCAGRCARSCIQAYLLVICERGAQESWLAAPTVLLIWCGLPISSHPGVTTTGKWPETGKLRPTEVILINDYDFTVNDITLRSAVSQNQ